MAAMISQRHVMATLLSELTNRYSALKFKKGKSFYWSPREQIVYHSDIENEADTWTLLHETSHGLLQHTNYASDFELLRLELAAWEKAKKLAAEHGITINNDHIEDCLDTYRDWLHKRSLCPICNVKSLQISNDSYGCMNCSTTWRVSKSRLCRPYRTLTARS
jgi:IrrE N-terminal-like domain